MGKKIIIPTAPLRRKLMEAARERPCSDEARLQGRPVSGPHGRAPPRKATHAYKQSVRPFGRCLHRRAHRRPHLDRSSGNAPAGRFAETYAWLRCAGAAVTLLLLASLPAWVGNSYYINIASKLTDLERLAVRSGSRKLSAFTGKRREPTPAYFDRLMKRYPTQVMAALDRWTTPSFSF
jgi:hypothetical protein